MSAVSSRVDALQARTTRRLPKSSPQVAFALLLALGFALVLWQTRGLSFYGDEWDYLLDRRGLSAQVLLRPHGPHLTLVPILVYKVLLAVFGAGSYLPFRILAALDLVLVALVLGIACRMFWGRWWGLAPVLLLVTLGPGGVTLLWPFQVGYAVALAAGVLALLALDRGGPRTDALCCAALIVSLASGSQGIGFVVGCAIMLALQKDWRRRAWVVAVPTLLYVLWYAKYGHAYSETHLSLWKNSLSYSMQALSATLAGAVGLSTVSPQTGLLDTTFGVPLAVGAVAALIVASWRGWRPRPLFWGIAVTLVVLWVAASLSNYGPFSRPPADPRYLSSDVALLFLCLCTALPPPSLRRAGVVAAAIVVIIIAATNAAQYTETRTTYRTATTASRAELGGLLILRGVVPATFSPALPGDPSVLATVRAKPFFSAVDSFGMVADSPSALTREDESTRHAVDLELSRGELSLAPAPQGIVSAGITPTVVSGAPRTSGSCLILRQGPTAIRASPGRYELTAGPRSPLEVTVRRFATTDWVPLGNVRPRTAAIVSVRADRAPQQPWQMMLSGAEGRVCGVRS